MNTIKIMLLIALTSTTFAVQRLNVTASLFYFGIMVLGAALYQISEQKEGNK